MSWASHNPELYDEICERGIVNKIIRTVEQYANDCPPEDDVALIVSALYQEDTVRDALLSWANSSICDAEANHWARQVDQARDRMKG